MFEYDPSGNLVKDGLNRLEFSYNCLNLMQTVQTTVGASKAQFAYGSDGRKLSEKAGTGGFEYLGSLIYAYRGGTLSLAQAVTDEGMIQSAGVNYFIRDHLGSVRAVVDHTGKTVERNDYYPFGGRHENASLPLTGVNRYKFGGKETLEPVSLDMLDFGARFYDPRIARWNTQDRYAEKYPSVSPYSYCANNPINITDPTGDTLRLSIDGQTYRVDHQGWFGFGLFNADGSQATELPLIATTILSDIQSIASPSTPTGEGMVDEIMSSHHSVYISLGNKNYYDSKDTFLAAANLEEFRAELEAINLLFQQGGIPPGCGGTIQYNPFSFLGGFNTSGNQYRPPFIGLAHEMGHALDALRGNLYFNHDKGIYRAKHQGVFKSEWQAVYRENMIRKELGLPLRTHYYIDNGRPSGASMLDPEGRPLGY